MSNFRRNLIGASENASIFDTAYFYCPFNKTKTVIDINGSFTPSLNTGTFNEYGYHTDGVNQSLVYTNPNLLQIFNSNKEFTLFTECIIYRVNRNQCIIGVFWSNSHIISLYIYNSKTKLAATCDLGIYFDDAIPNAPSLEYGKKYKICIRWQLNGKVYFFINGTKTNINHGRQIKDCVAFYIGGSSRRNDRYSNADFLTIAAWSRCLTDEECIKMTM